MGKNKKTLSIFLSLLLVLLVGSLVFKHKVIPQQEKSSDSTLLLSNEDISLTLPSSISHNHPSIAASVTEDVPWGSIRAYDFKPDGLKFDEPATAQFGVSDIKLPPGVKKESLRVAVLENGRWKILQDSKFNPISGKVEAPIDHFSSYGIVPEPGEINGIGMEFELNGITLQSSEEIYARLKVTPDIIRIYLAEEPGKNVTLTLSGLPEGEEHFLYVNNYDTVHSVTEGSIELSLDLDKIYVLWVQQFQGTVSIWGEGDDCEWPLGERSGNTCTLLNNIEGNVSIDADDQVLDCAGHNITPGDGAIGVLVSEKSNVELRNCTIGEPGNGYSIGFEVIDSDHVTITSCDFVDNDYAIAFEPASLSTVEFTTISGSASTVGLFIIEGSSDNEIHDNVIETPAVTYSCGMHFWGGVVYACDNLIYDNEIQSSEEGIKFDTAIDNELYGNTIEAGTNGISLEAESWPNKIYHNNISGDVNGIFSFSPAEVSWESEGNYWGRSCPGPLFIPGTDSNSVDVVDSFPYGQEDAWDFGLSPGCITGDMDGDTVPDAEDNCPEVWNPGQENVDGFGEGDACDETPPDPPVITSPPSGLVTNDANLEITGTAERMSRVEISANGAFVGEAYTLWEGTFSFIPTEPYPDGVHNFVATSTDAAGNTSNPSNIVTVTIVTSIPPSPEIIHPYNDEVIHEFPIPVFGYSAPFSSVLFFIYGIFIGETVSDDIGAFEFMINDLPEGSQELTAIAINQVGTESPVSDPVEFSFKMISEEEPVAGDNNKFWITNIQDSPDPFDPLKEETTLKINLDTMRLFRLKRANRWHEFRAITTWEIKSIETGEIAKTVKSEISKRGGFFRRWQKLQGEIAAQWDGEDEIGLLPDPGAMYSYDITTNLVRVYIGPGQGPRRCRRGEEEITLPGIDKLVCKIDQASLINAGTINISPTGFSQVRFAALEWLYRTNADANAWRPDTGMPPGRLGKQSSMRGVLRAISAPGMAIPVANLPPGSTPEQAARTFLNQWGDLFGIVDPSVELVINSISVGPSSEFFIHLDQITPSGRPVFAHRLVVTLTPDMHVAGVVGLFLPSPPDGPTLVSGEEAKNIALSAVAVAGEVVNEPTLGVYDPEVFKANRDPARLTWEVDIHTKEPAIWRHYVDAETGVILFVYDALPHVQRREVWWANHGEEIPGEEIIWKYYPPFWYESWPGTSEAIYNGNTATWNYYWNRHERDGWDHNLDPEHHDLITSSDCWEVGYDNAMWNPWLRMAFFGDKAACTDIVGHEVTHGVNQVHGHLTLIGQSGSLSESFSDIFGEFVERYSSGSGPDWIHGTELSTPPDSCYPVRDIANCESPRCGECPTQPAHFSNYNRWVGDDPVHHNASIPSKAGWLLGRETSQGPVTFAGITVTGIGEVDAGRVWYDALTSRFTPYSTFTDFRYAIINSAASLFGVGEDKYIESLRSVDAIGVWSADYWENFDTQHRPALAMFTVSGEDRRYIFYREPVDTDPQLFYRYRTCVIYGGCSWSAATPLDNAGSGPAAVVFDNKLWVFAKYHWSNYIVYKTLNPDGTWNPLDQPTGLPETDNDVAAAAFNGKLYLFYKDVGSGAKVIMYHTWTPGVGWQGPLPTGATSENGPAAAAPYNNVLALFYVRGTTSPNLRYRSLNTIGTWSLESTPEDNLSTAWVGSPTIYIFKNRLHAAGRSSDNDIIYRSVCGSGVGCTYRPGEWTWNVKLDPGARDFVTLFEDGANHLYLFFRDESANAVYWRFKRSE